jgi:hypothetical protein
VYPSLEKVVFGQVPKAELEMVLLGKTKRPAGFFVGQMVNMPLEIVEIMHQQLDLDMDWGVEHALRGEDELLILGPLYKLLPPIVWPHHRRPSSTLTMTFWNNMPNFLTQLNCPNSMEWKKCPVVPF